MNKKIILSLFLVLLVAISVSAVSAEATDDAIVADAAVDEVAADATVDEVAADEAIEEVISDVEVDEVVAEADPVVTDEPTLTDGEEKTGADIQSAIDSTADGGEVNLGENQVYNVEDGQIFNFTKKLTFKGNNVTIKASGASQGGSGALFVANKAGCGFDGLTFINTDGPKTYTQAISGYAIQLAIENGTVNNCKFINWGSGVSGRGAAFCNITNCYFNGSSEKVTNGGTKEYGTKAINLMGSHDITVKGCTFEGQVLDGISIASNSGNNIMTDNTFIDNCYAIYFGGASTQGCVIANNTFIRCGYCKDQNGNIIFKDLPVISTQKAANGYIIADNDFEATEGSILLKAESGNTAHGYPSLIGDINITGNTVTATEGATPESITFVYLFSNKGALNPYAPINISGNTIEAGITPVTVWYNDWGSPSNPVIPAADKVATSINIIEVLTADRQITVALMDINGEAQAGKEILYTINGGETQIVETDPEGVATIDVTEDGVIAFAFEGDSQLKAAETSINFVTTSTQRSASEIEYSDMNTVAVDTTTDGRVGDYFKVTLKDGDGNILVDKDIQIGFNGKIYNKTTDENGQAQLQINLPKDGTYTFAVSFLGDDEFNASFIVAKIVVAKQTPTLTVPAKSYAASAKTKSLTATFKAASGKVVKGKKVTFTVNGKNYTATTNANGVATVNVSISTKGSYTVTAKFAGDNTYAAVSKTAKLTIK
jgi:parallel beta-helix repeat protein